MKISHLFASLFLLITVPTVEAGTFGFLKYNQHTIGSYVELSAAPGMEVKEKFIIRNESDQVATYNVDVVDAEVATEESFSLKPESAVQSQLGLWATVAYSEITIQPGEYEVMELLVSVPEGTATGSYWGGITGMSVPVNPVNGNTDSGAVMQIRNGIRVHLTVVPKEEYVPVIEEDALAGGGKSYTQYILPGLLIVFASVFIAINQQKDSKNKSILPRKNRK